MGRAEQPSPARVNDLLEADPALVTALESAVPGAVAARASDRLSYAHDASHYLLTPRAVVTPRDAQEVAAVLQTIRREGLHLTFRSGGTSLSGQATGDGVLVDTRRHFRAIEVLDGGARVRAQPGATVRAVNARLAGYGRMLGPDPASEAACTIGGVVANNSSGMACGVDFNTYRTLESAVLVLPSGTVLDTGTADADERLQQVEPEIHAGLASLRDRVRADPVSRETIGRLYAIKNTMGYGLNSFTDHDRPVDVLVRLVVGSEGTLAFVAEATFRTVPLHRHAATGLLVFPDLAAATAALPALVDAGFATIELLDATSLRVAQRDPEADGELRDLEVRDHAALLVELRDEAPGALAARASAANEVLSALGLAGSGLLSADPGTRAALWHIRKGLYAAVAGARPSGTTALLEDIAVPVERLLPTCQALVALFERHGYADSVIFGHAKDGNIHFLLNEEFHRPEKVDRYLAFTDDLVDLVLGQGGTLKAEHGTGRIMAPFVRRQYGDELYEVMVAVKRLLDPDGLLNPGILLNEDPGAHVDNLKSAPSVEPEVDRCVECGYCEPVCPSKDLTTTPRRRIVLRREIARAREAGETPLAARLEEEYQYDAVDTCAVDGMCQTACPVLIDTGDLVRGLRAGQHGGTEQRAWRGAARHWDGFTRLAAGALTLAKAVPAVAEAATRAGRGVLGAGTVPAWTADLPRGGRARRPRGADAPQAVYFPACISTMFGPAGGGAGIPEAFLALCDRAGVAVRVPEGIAGLCCGTPWKSKGLTAGHAAMRERVVPAVQGATQEGTLPLVVDAASCTEGLRDIVAPASRPAVMDVVDFVEAVLLPRLPEVRRLPSLVVHPTCSSTRLGSNAALLRLASAMADEVVVPDEWGCCAFAGDRGLLHPELTASATAAEARAVESQAASAYVSVNRTCELALSRATGRPYRHVIEVLEELTVPRRV